MNSTPINLLLADDDLDDCLFFQEALDEIAVATQLTIVNDGVQLMKKLLEPGYSLPEVLFLDLNMPRKNGFECLGEIKANQKLADLPVIIFSTSFDRDVVDRLYERGASYYLRKPSEFRNLKKVISTSIDLIKKSPVGKIPKEQFVVNAN